MKIICLDMEGVIAPEIWIELAERTGIDALRRTTRDEPDYDVLMRSRLDILHSHGIGMEALEPIIDGIEPLPGAVEFLDTLRRDWQVVILSDTFYEFVGPLMVKLGRPTLFCHRIVANGDGRLTGYELRLPNHKQAAVDAFRALNFTVFAAGDSYNDTRMLGAADAGFLFRPPQNVIDEFPQFPVHTDYATLIEAFRAAEQEQLSSRPKRAISAG